MPDNLVDDLRPLRGLPRAERLRLMNEKVARYLAPRTRVIERTETVRERAVVRPVEMDESARRRIAALEAQVAELLARVPPAAPEAAVLIPGEGVDDWAEQPRDAPEPDAAGEPLPDALARLVPADIEHERRMQYLRERWQQLTHKLMSPQAFGEMGAAERVEHQELERYRGLFT